MLTIGELADRAGTTVRAVRHYHRIGLLPEPDRDHSGYRRYDAGAVVELIRIRALATAGVPLARVPELLVADAESFAVAMADVDRRLRAEIEQRQRHRESIARITAGDGVALPATVTAVLDRLRALGVDERIVGVERDGWILLTAHRPRQVDVWATRKRELLADGPLVDFFLELGDALDHPADDASPAGPAERLSVRMGLLIDMAAEHGDGVDLAPSLIELLDALALDGLPSARPLIALLRDRGRLGWAGTDRTALSRPAR